MCLLYDRYHDNSGLWGHLLQDHHRPHDNRDFDSGASGKFRSTDPRSSFLPLLLLLLLILLPFLPPSFLFRSVYLPAPVRVALSPWLPLPTPLAATAAAAAAAAFLLFLLSVYSFVCARYCLSRWKIQVTHSKTFPIHIN